MTQMSPPVLRPDLCIVGAGRAGLTAATGAAALGVNTVLIDRADLARALPRAGGIAGLVLRDAARRATDRPPLDWRGMTETASAAAETRAPGMSAAHFRALGLHVVHGSARFTNARTLDAGGVPVMPRRFILATGVVPAVPALPGLDSVPWSRADDWLGLAALPRRLIILGAGRTGVEMAQWLTRLGASVTLVDGASPLRGFDREFADPVLAQLRREGVYLLANRTVLRAEPGEGGLDLILAKEDGSEERISGDHLMLATGRRPAVDGFDLDLAGIRCDPQGIAVGPDGRTSVPKIFAIGDVTGRGRSSEAAEAQAGVALRAALFKQRVAFDPRGTPRILRTDPEIAVIGLSETEARDKFGRIGVWRWPYAETDRACASGVTRGHIKIITTASKRIVSAGIVAPEAAEAIGLWTLAITHHLTLADIAALPLPVSAHADLSRRVALQGVIAGLDAPWIRKALKMVRWLG